MATDSKIKVRKMFDTVFRGVAQSVDRANEMIARGYRALVIGFDWSLLQKASGSTAIRHRIVCSLSRTPAHDGNGECTPIRKLVAL
jgi:hypothetical protein